VHRTGLLLLALLVAAMPTAASECDLGCGFGMPMAAMPHQHRHASNPGGRSMPGQPGRDTCGHDHVTVRRGVTTPIAFVQSPVVTAAIVVSIPPALRTTAAASTQLFHPPPLRPPARLALRI
jgi:hypothetical protein